MCDQPPKGLRFVRFIFVSQDQIAMAVLVSRRPTLPDASFTVPAVSLVPDLFKSLLSDRFKSLFGPHQRYVIITEKGIHNFVTHEHVARGTGLSELSDEGEARGFVARTCDNPSCRTS